MRYLHEYLQEEIERIHALLASGEHEEKRRLLEFELNVYKEILEKLKEVYVTK